MRFSLSTRLTVEFLGTGLLSAVVVGVLDLSNRLVND